MASLPRRSLRARQSVEAATLPAVTATEVTSAAAPAATTESAEPPPPPKIAFWRRAFHRVRQGLDWSSLGLGLAGTGLVFASIMPAGGIIAAVGMGIHLINNIDNYCTPGKTKLETFFKSSMFVAGASALAWSILAITLGASNPAGWILLIVGHVGVAAGILALMYKHRREGFLGCIKHTAADCWRLMFPDHSPVAKPAASAASGEATATPASASSETAAPAATPVPANTLPVPIPPAPSRKPRVARGVIPAPEPSPS